MNSLPFLLCQSEIIVVLHYGQAVKYVQVPKMLGVLCFCIRSTSFPALAELIKFRESTRCIAL